MRGIEREGTRGTTANRDMADMKGRVRKRGGNIAEGRGGEREKGREGEIQAIERDTERGRRNTGIADIRMNLHPLVHPAPHRNRKYRQANREGDESQWVDPVNKPVPYRLGNRQFWIANRAEPHGRSKKVEGAQRVILHHQSGRKGVHQESKIFRSHTQTHTHDHTHEHSQGVPLDGDAEMARVPQWKKAMMKKRINQVEEEMAREKQRQEEEEEAYMVCACLCVLKK